MNRKTIILFILCVFSVSLCAQQTENENDLYWQPDRKITFSDYQSESDTICVKYNKKYGMQMQSSIGFRWVVDVPKKRKGKIDKGYLVPVFCKNCSCILSEDSLGLKTDQLLFDITEVCARNARRELDAFQQSGNIDNPNEMFFVSVKNKWEENKSSFFATAIREILIEKQEGAYEKWRATTDELLEKTKEYATKPEDCYRFIVGKPIEKGYKKAKNIVGDLRNKNEK
ncbi:hypothetical protein M2138_001290 [Dysgonomonadaceae bacterium PH5-43]|nr:hypothetical protein [Dysgonomonadaceae bacterium PH5-43]